MSIYSALDMECCLIFEQPLVQEIHVHFHLLSYGASVYETPLVVLFMDCMNMHVIQVHFKYCQIHWHNVCCVPTCSKSHLELFLGLFDSAAETAASGFRQTTSV
jgi:hypothetical protein